MIKVRSDCRTKPVVALKILIINPRGIGKIVTVTKTIFKSQKQ